MKLLEGSNVHENIIRQLLHDEFLDGKLGPRLSAGAVSKIPFFQFYGRFISALLHSKEGLSNFLSDRQ